ncbi:MAG: glycosyltransferase family 4 protein [Gammaproteobacteria bacterium]
MKILHLEAGRHLYGGARQVGNLINGLADEGVDNLLVCMAGHELVDRVRAEVAELRLGGDVDLSLSRRLQRLAREARPDVIHVHSRRGADTFGGRAARSAGIPSILTRRVQSAEPAAWLRFKCRPYSRTVAISSAVRAELERAGIDRDRLRLIPSAVDVNRLQPEPEARAGVIRRYGLPDDALIAVSAAQLIRRKALDFLLPLAARLVASQPRFRLLLFGQGPQRARLESQAVRLGLEGRVLFCGFDPEWSQLLPGFDLLLHPARREGLGAVVLEAMSAGLPVVASAVGGIVDVIEDGVDGCLVAPDAGNDWYRVVHDLLENPDRRARLGVEARRTVESRFTIEGMTESYLELYEEVIGHDTAH